jgi:hypothetical protein
VFAVTRARHGGVRVVRPVRLSVQRLRCLVVLDGLDHLDDLGGRPLHDFDVAIRLLHVVVPALLYSVRMTRSRIKEKSSAGADCLIQPLQTTTACPTPRKPRHDRYNASSIVAAIVAPQNARP